MKQQIKIPINNSEDIEELFGFNISQRLRALLEDYEIVATRMQMALVERRPHNNHLIDNLRAAVVASSLHLQSIDYAKRRYCKEQNNDADARESIDLFYVNSYKSARDHMQTVMSRFIKSNKVPSLGVFGAGLVLERLSS